MVNQQMLPIAASTAQRRGGLTLGEWGLKAGNMDYSAVFMAIRGYETRAKRKAQLMEALSR